MHGVSERRIEIEGGMNLFKAAYQYLAWLTNQVV